MSCVPSGCAAVFGVADVLGLSTIAPARAALPAAVAGNDGVDRGLLPTGRQLYRDVKDRIRRPTGEDA